MYKILLAFIFLLLLPVVVYAAPAYSFSPEILALQPNIEKSIDIRIYGATDRSAVEVVLNYSNNIEIMSITESGGTLGLNKKTGSGIATIDLAKIGGSSFTEGEVIATIVVKLLYGDSGSIVVNTLPPGEAESSLDITGSSSSSYSESKIDIYSQDEYEKVFGSIDVSSTGIANIFQILGLFLIFLSLPLLAVFFLLRAKRARAMLETNNTSIVS